MGRRKIEIQPITHERNRSVTFLKRKNGLFKKAYELGVLCSVDVAVIIFEERPGHHVKLYQYCSTDIHNIVERHMRYDGEKDTRTPVDFSNNPSKLDDQVDLDDDDQDDDDNPAPLRGTLKKGMPSKVKSEFNPGSKMMPPGGNDMSIDINMDYHLQRPMTIPPPPMSMHHSQLSPSTGGSALPISGERHNASAPSRLAVGVPQQGSNKKQRLAPQISGDYHHLSTSAASFSRHPQQSPSHSFNSNPFFGAPSPPPQQPAFLQHSPPFEFPTSSSRPPARTVSYPLRPSQYSPQQDNHPQGVYPQLVRPPAHHTSQHRPTSAHGQTDLFAAFLDADEQRQAQGQAAAAAQQFGALDWPVHAPQPPPPGQPSQDPGNYLPFAQPPSSSSSSTTDPAWLDFLTGTQTQQPPPPPSSASASSRTEGVSWERERGEVYTRSDGVGAGQSASGSASSVSPTIKKRLRVDSEGQPGVDDPDAGEKLSATSPISSVGRRYANGSVRNGDKGGDEAGDGE